MVRKSLIGFPRQARPRPRHAYASSSLGRAHTQTEKLKIESESLSGCVHDDKLAIDARSCKVPDYALRKLKVSRTVFLRIREFDQPGSRWSFVQPFRHHAREMNPFAIRIRHARLLRGGGRRGWRPLARQRQQVAQRYPCPTLADLRRLLRVELDSPVRRSLIRQLVHRRRLLWLSFFEGGMSTQSSSKCDRGKRWMGGVTVHACQWLSGHTHGRACRRVRQVGVFRLPRLEWECPMGAFDCGCRRR